MGLFEVLKSQHEETIFSLQHCNLITDQNENAEEWIGHFRIIGNERCYKEKDSRLKEPFIHGINDDDIMTEIIRKLTAFKKLIK